MTTPPRIKTRVDPEAWQRVMAALNAAARTATPITPPASQVREEQPAKPKAS
ncbi:hypothetical protein [Deinococcus hopiensis]|uniref:Uncharacterized protein n=1 Tax=Deinococcus hopiensis KR-140 TaxID=695939 RepID=A0A1W1VK04_9DEIO|nr:hypothetical protein [Deinococcus hopiensis]SMB93391.1 hypothetical protein SAMN00790413_01963 [Deinococcus hopiensis KR-140]